MIFWKGISIIRSINVTGLTCCINCAAAIKTELAIFSGFGQIWELLQDT